MDLVRFVQFRAVNVDALTTDLHGIPGESDDALNEWNVSVGWRLEGDDVEPVYRSLRQICTDCGWIICRKRDLVQKEMIAHENGRFHRFRWYLGRLCHIAREHEDKNNGEDEAFNPLPERTFMSDRGGLEGNELIQADIRTIKDDQISDEHVGSFFLLTFYLGSRSFDHLRQFFLYELTDARAVRSFPGEARHGRLHDFSHILHRRSARF